MIKFDFLFEVHHFLGGVLSSITTLHVLQQQEVGF